MLSELQRARISKLANLGACGTARDWVATAEGSAQELWDKCPRGDWMFWLISETADSEPWSDERKKFCLAALECADLAAQFRSTAMNSAVDTIKSYLRGEGSMEVARETVEIIEALYIRGLTPECKAHEAVYDAVYVLENPTYNVYEVVTDVYRAFNDDETILAQCADIVRKHYPIVPIGE